jgi:hypothetical protein
MPAQNIHYLLPFASSPTNLSFRSFKPLQLPKLLVIKYIFEVGQVFITPIHWTALLNITNPQVFFSLSVSSISFSVSTFTISFFLLLHSEMGYPNFYDISHHIRKHLCRTNINILTTSCFVLLNENRAFIPKQAFITIKT